MKKFLTILLVSLLFLNLCAIDFDPEAGYRRFKKGIMLGGSVYPEYEGSSFLLDLNITGTFEFDMLGFGLQFPIRFIIDNNDNIETTAGVFPKEDWDDARDWTMLLSYFHYGHSGDLFYFFFGNHRNRYVGNGSILGAYYTDLKLYYPKRGIDVEINTDYLGIDFFMDDVTPPTVIGGRFYFKPLSFLSKENYGNNLELGFTYFTDFAAPYDITSSDVGEKERNISKYSVQMFGFDVNFRLLTLKPYHLTFYTDVNHIVDAGTGIHIGLKHKIDFSAKSDIKLLSKWEIRAMQSNYIPSYFNTFYDIEREYYKNGESKGKYISTWLSDDRGWTCGYYFDLVFSIAELFSVGASVEHNRLYNRNSTDYNKYNNIQLSFLLNAFLFKHLDIDFVMTLQTLGEKGKELSDKPFYRASVAYVINKYFSLGFSASSKWLLVYDRNNVGGFDSYYKAVNSFAVGAFGGFSF
ncbi:hypothetical protein J5834_04620 [bacterium]|nr:hypothetical protein [bacterium]